MAIKNGDTFERLTVVGLSHFKSRGKWREKIWACACSCGGKVSVSHSSLTGGKRRSCGCLFKEWVARRPKYGTHFKTKSGTWRSWVAMKQRCTSDSPCFFKNYKGRGIAYDPQWEKFEPFYEDMGDRPDGMTLERVNNNLGYSKQNCIWATCKQQQNNRRSNRLVCYNGSQMTLAQASELSGIERRVTSLRLDRGWSEERTFSEPVRTSKKTPRK